VERAVQVWEQPGSSLQGLAGDLATDQYTEERATKLRAHADLLDRLAQEARERAEEARHVYERFAAILAGRQQPPGDDVAPEEEAVPPQPWPTLPAVRAKGKAPRGKRGARGTGQDSAS
jgi:hypothetical protein